jgi:anaerobic selenocysteine-containing dehydrogenase
MTRSRRPPIGGGTSDRYQPVAWEFALDRAAERLRATDPARSFFYSSGRSSNEAGFVLQLLARLRGRMKDVRVQAYDLPRGNPMAYFPEANVLTSTAVDPESRTPAFKSTPVWLE